MTLVGFQKWLVHAFARWTTVGRFMHTAWGWPAAESVHFVGLSLLFGTLAVWDLRLLGVGRRIPVSSLHALVRWVLIGYALSVTSGVAFLMAEPTEYIYNVAFHDKVLFMLLAGINAGVFYLTVGRRTLARGADQDAPLPAKVFAVVSLAMWIGVIVSGRLLTFYRPGWCGVEIPSVVASCVPQIWP